MARPRSDTRERLIESAGRLLRSQGYHGTGMTQIVAESGAPRGSVYFLFPGGKEELTAEAVTVSATEFADRLNQAGTAPDLAGFAAALTAHLATELEESDYTDGCPITTVTLDVAPRSEVLTEACRRAYADWLAILERVLVAYGIPAERAPGLAVLSLSAVEGALVLCRASRDIAPLTAVRGELLALLERAIADD